MIDISCIMPCWTLNDQIQKMTENAIESVSGTPLIIIDNASPQGGGYLRSKADMYIRNKENLGFARAVNQGIKLAQTRYVAIVSTDTRVSPNWREVADQVFAEHTDTFSVHFRMTDYDVPFTYGDKTFYEGRERWCTAAFFILDREKQLFFDENYFNSFDDWDLFYRAHLVGYKLAYTNKAVYQHAHSFTQKFVGFKGTDENKAYFIKKHGIDPNELLAQTYPEQMKEDYYGGFI